MLDLVKDYALTWGSLDKYDKSDLPNKGSNKKSVKIHAHELSSAIEQLKLNLVKKGEATELFAQERRNDSIAGIIGNVLQKFGGSPVYATLEEKAAHLLYFIVKNHPFSDGNKRSGAFAFIWFLKKAKIRGQKYINPASLATITLMIAESDPKKKKI